MGTRRRARVLALQFLYQIEINAIDMDESLDLFWLSNRATPEERTYATQLIRGTRENREKIDPLIARYTRNWDLERMAAVDRNILRLAAYEMIFSRGAPPVVVINEAIDIAKKYSTPDSGAFVNGILDKLRKERMTDEKAVE